MQEIIELKTSDVKKIREELLQNQGGVCLLCGRIPERPCLDHDHKKRVGGSGLCRGTLCNGCNILFGKMENNCVRYGISQVFLPEFLIRSAKYKVAEQTNYLHPSEREKPKLLKKSQFNRVIKYWSQTHSRKKKPVWKIKPKMKLTKQWEKYIKEADEIHYAKYK